MFIITITEHAPTPDGTDVNSYHQHADTMQEALRILDDQDVNFTVWINVSITKVPS